MCLRDWGLHHRVLADLLGEGLGTIFAGEDTIGGDIGHGTAFRCAVCHVDPRMSHFTRGATARAPYCIAIEVGGWTSNPCQTR
jgi:hypothetical protein